MRDISVGNIVTLENGQVCICFDVSERYTYLAPYNKELDSMDLTDVYVYADLNDTPIESIENVMGSEE